MNLTIIRFHSSIGCSMRTFTLIRIQIFSNGLPRRRPVIFTFIIPNVYVTSWLVKTIKHIAQNSAICTRFCKTITACVVGNNCSIFWGTKVICPRSWCVRSGNYILSFLVIKISVLHSSISPLVIKFISIYLVQNQVPHQ